jgi:2-polyprenyl-3-methyl-5-hydroxy-6-metoxy-1,4-benzoquinol methylase
MVMRVVQDSDNLQGNIKNWWETNPMTYDWRKTLTYEEGSIEFYREIDRRFWIAAWFAHKLGEEPFGRLIEYPLLCGKRALEIGCGAGSISAELAKHGALVTAIDLASHAIALTRRRFELFGLSGDIRQMDAEHLDFADETFDFVWSWGVIHHSANTENRIGEIHRVLKNGGEARVMVYHRHSINFWAGLILIHGLLFGELFRYSVQELCNKYSDGFIAKYYTSTQMKAMFQKHFQNVKTDIYGQKNEIWQIPGSRFKDILVGIIPKFLGWWLTRRFGGFLFLRATK